MTEGICCRKFTLESVVMTKFLCVMLVALFGSTSIAYGLDNRAKPDSALEDFSVGFGAEFETGSYGGDTTLDSWRGSLVLDWYPAAWLGLSLEIPFVSQTSSRDAVIVGGRLMPRRGNGGGTGTTVVQSETRTESGLGDLTLDADLRLLAETDSHPGFGALLYAKAPTADTDKGLGTGEFDWGAGLRASKIVGDWSLSAKALHIQPGTSSLYKPDPYWDWSASLNYLGYLSLRPGIGLNGGTAAFDSEDDPLEISARLGILGSGRTSVSLDLAHGLSDGSPDWSGGIFCFFDF